MRLYYRPGTGRPVRVAWMLEEIGAHYEVVRLSAEETKQAEHLARHPLGRVPVLEQDGRTLFESAGVCLQLADQYPQAGLIGAVGSRERALVYQWTTFAMTELEPAVVQFLANRQSDPARAEAGAERFSTAAAAVEQALGEREFLVAEGLSVADVVTGAVLGLGTVGRLTAGQPRVSAYVGRLRERPAFQRAAAATEASIRD